jgi:hypothetical protein
LVIIPGLIEGILQFEERLRPKGVMDLGAIDGDLGNALSALINDVFIVPIGYPVGDHAAGRVSLNRLAHER